jgi:RNA polymerase sigma-70 factor (ECF subfamily)
MNNRNSIIEDFYKANYNKLVKKVSGRAATPENAEDIVQNAFVKGLQYWDSYNPQVKGLDEWFGCILNNCLKDFMKDERNYGMAMEFDEEEVAGIEMSSIPDNLKEKITKEIGLASVKNQQVLTLYYCQGHTVSEIVQMTGLKPKHVKLIAERFRNHMQQGYKAKL